MDGGKACDGPTKGIWRRFYLIVPLTLVLAVCSFLYIRSKAGYLETMGHVTYEDADPASLEVRLSDPSVVEVRTIRLTDMGLAWVGFRALVDGTCTATLAESSRDGTDVWHLEVKDGMVIEGGVNFGGWEVLQLDLVVLLCALVALFASVFVELYRVSWYGYTMVAAGGGALFCLFQLAFFGVLLSRSGNPTFYFFLFDVANMVDYFAALSVYLMLPLALAVSISNIALIRHEGRRPVNLLGVAASAVWVAAYLFMVTWHDAGDAVFAALRLAVPVAMALGTCLLLSTMLSAWLAARHVPDRAMDYLIICGCGIRQDGTPCPLLAGRVDRAVDFDARRVSAGDAPATFVPSGGQGPDEPMSEARSMRDCLERVHGIAPERIVLEDASTTTRENMAFSREVIERHARRDASELAIGFSTTNYHVFRGYVCAHQSGMAVEGMGSPTKYYFWPNAFLREFIGLLANKWLAFLQLYVVALTLYGLAGHLLDVAHI